MFRVKILKGKAKREDCVIKQEDITLIVDEKEIVIVPFMQKILLNAVMRVVGELEKCKGCRDIIVKIKRKYHNFIKYTFFMNI